MKEARKLIQSFYRFTITTITGKHYAGYVDKDSEEHFLVVHSSRNLCSGARTILSHEKIAKIEYSNKKYGGVIYDRESSKV